ncbi:MAG: hypothetical protein JXA49_06340 [Actinobacteria bacterium]|nr:hypothetical protein [Actinomycetota bacterium]
MRKAVTVLLLLSVLLVSGAVVPGCGKNDKEPEELQGIIEKSNRKMQVVKTFNLDFKSVLDAPVISKEKEKLDMVVSADIGDRNNPKYHIRFSGMGTESEAYSIDDYAYAFVPEKGWLKSLTTEVRDLMNVFQLSPSELDKLTGNAKNLELKDETDESYVISFEVGPKFFEQAILNQDIVDELGPEVKYMIEEMSKRTSIDAVITIDKETMLVDEVDLEMYVEDVELLGDINLAIKAVFSNYNKPVDIALPEAAANAREAAPDEIMEILEQLPI